MDAFTTYVSEPILNLLVLLYDNLFSNVGLAIIALTIIIRLVMLPLTIKQLRSSKAMSEQMRDLHPKLQALQKKYKDKDKQKLAEETMNLYKEAGISPMGCLTSPTLITMIIQMPIWFGLVRAIRYSAEGIESLQEHLYSWAVPMVGEGLNHDFLWLNLDQEDYIIPVLVAASMWFSQKMIILPSSDPKQQQMNQMMMIMMPLMLGIISIQFPSGLALYILVSTLIGIAIQYPIYGWKRQAPSVKVQSEEKKPDELEVSTKDVPEDLAQQEQRGDVHREKSSEVRRPVKARRKKPKKKG